MMSWFAVAVGGALGATLRYALALQYAVSPGRFPVATFVANSVGCLLMGIGFMLIVERALVPEIWRNFLLVGVLGAFTTFSTFAIETLSLMQIGDWKMSVIYILASVLSSIVAAGAGVFIVKLFFNLFTFGP